MPEWVQWSAKDSRHVPIDSGGSDGTLVAGLLAWKGDHCGVKLKVQSRQERRRDYFRGVHFKHSGEGSRRLRESGKACASGGQEKESTDS